MDETTIVELKNVTKTFPGVTALSNMSLRIRKGEIHGLIGENGAGKSTLIKVLTGVYQPDGGEILINGRPQTFSVPNDAREAGIACVYQELNIIQQLSITDNLFLGNYQKKTNRLLDHRAMRARATEVLHSLEQDVDPDTLCGLLGIGLQQMVEIGKAILLNAQVIILDEPTSSLGEKEIANLFKTVRLLKEQGVSFLFVSHKLEEIFDLCDTVTVMRDSRHIVTLPVAEATRDLLITHMVGRTLDTFYPKVKTTVGETVLAVCDLTRAGEYYHINFEARRGEILGFSGLVGAGRTELFRGIFAADLPDSGEIRIHGKACRLRNPKDAIRNKLAFLTEDRKHQGLILPFSVDWNIGLVILGKIKQIFWGKKTMKEAGGELIRKLRIKVATSAQLAEQLSGGNQQKVVIAKWLLADADVYVFDEPTKGIDVGAKVEVYNIMNELAQQGKCVIMISSELSEILGMSDRVIVMRKGRMTADIDRSDSRFNQEDIMKAAWGVA